MGQTALWIRAPSFRTAFTGVSTSNGCKLKTGHGMKTGIQSERTDKIGGKEGGVVSPNRER